jgi:hypothetical protein
VDGGGWVARSKDGKVADKGRRSFLRRVEDYNGITQEVLAVNV